MQLVLANVAGRGHLVLPDRTVSDLEAISAGRFPADPSEAFARWDDLRDFAAGLNDPPSIPLDRADLRAPSPRPRQIFGIGLNYRSHAEESNLPIPTQPLTFTKYPSSVGTPDCDVPVVGERCDFEAEVVVVIGIGGRDIPESRAWNAVAGIAVGQDISDRALQFATQPPQFSLGKSRRNFSPFGPWLVDAAGVEDRDRLTLSCTLNDEEMQHTTTDDLIFSVPQMVSYLSGIVDLLPGDVIFTGTPGGVGGSRNPQRFLAPGDRLITTVEGIGSISNRCV
jgi:2-keto-4-pentenoate hydratase/2-oxohepta-3-ene-1,7-dioic acid hydratase in catechol pathway